MLLLPSVMVAQDNINRTIPVRSGQNVEFDFRYPELIRISNWDRNEIGITGSVNINMGENNDAFELVVDEGSTILVTSKIRDYDKLPQRIVVRQDDKEYVFNTNDWNDPELQKFFDEHGRSGYQWISHGVMKDIKLTIMVPRNINVSVYAKHGLIELVDFTSSVRVNSKHGGVDVSIDPSDKVDLTVTSKYGDVYTNMDFAIDPKRNKDNLYSLGSFSAALNGGGAYKLDVESKHGNIYLRRAKN